MRIVMNGSGLKFLRTLGFQLGLAEAPPSPVPSLPPALKPKAMAAAAPQSNGFAFHDLQASIAVSEASRAMQEDMGLRTSSLLTARPPEDPAPREPDSSDEVLANLLRMMEKPAPEPRLVHEIRLDLQGLLEALSSQDTPHADSIAFPRNHQPTQYAALNGRKVTLALSGAELRSAQELLERQNCNVRILEGELTSTLSLESLDTEILVVGAPPEWELTEPIDPGFLSHTPASILVTGPRRLLTRLAQIPQPGPRDYLAAPWQEEEFAWRAAMLASRPALPKRLAETVPKREKPEILIADDDVTTRTLLGSLLSKHGMTCHIAENGSEALDIFKARRPCAAILDIIMPSMDGFQVLAAVKQDPALQRTPVILLTSRNSEVDKLQAFALGADDYLTKPFSPMELAVRLKRLLKRS
ncbi:MAG: response regulator [Bryobacterales bacterium]|nr:response regulator [Bryobacterales bacterium]